MHTFASVTDFRFLNKVVLEQIEIANAIISQQNGHIYVVCFQTGIVQADLSGPPSESFQNFKWSPPFRVSVTTDPPSVLLKIKWSPPKSSAPNYVGMSKDMEKRLPQLYYIKMKISYDLGFLAIGVAMAT